MVKKNYFEYLKEALSYSVHCFEAHYQIEHACLINTLIEQSLLVCDQITRTSHVSASYTKHNGCNI